jgi:hypothetical protein
MCEEALCFLQGALRRLLKIETIFRPAIFALGGPSSARDSLREFLYNDGLIENSITLCMLDRPPYFSCSTISGLKLRLLILDKNAVVFTPNQEKKKLKRRVMAIRVLNSQLPLL